MNTASLNNQYTIKGNNPLKNFSGNEDKESYSLEELKIFYFAHHPEKEECTFDDVKQMFKEIGGEVQLATTAGE